MVTSLHMLIDNGRYNRSRVFRITKLKSSKMFQRNKVLRIESLGLLGRDYYRNYQ